MRSSPPGSINKGPRARALCAGGQATGSYGISTQEKNHSIPKAREKPADREQSPLQEANLGGVPSPLKPSSKGSGKSKAKQPGVISGASADASLPEHVEDDSIMRKLLPSLRWLRRDERGNRINPEPPRLVAKVCKEEGKGELWLGPLPTARRMKVISGTKHSIQIYCFAADIESSRVNNSPGQGGLRVPGALVFRCEMFNANTRARHIESFIE